MKTKQTLTSIIAGAALALTTLTGSAQTGIKIERMQTLEKETSRTRPTFTYSLPGDIKGMTFIEFYDTGKDYYAKTGLTKKITGKLDARTDILDMSWAKDQAGFGLEYTLQASDKAVAKVKAMPVYFGFDGKYIESKAVLGFYYQQKVYVPILKDAMVVALGEIDVAAKGGPKWSYGELHVQKTLDDFVIGIGADLRTKGKLLPQPELSVKLGYVFGQK